MSTVNKRAKVDPVFTHEGARAANINALQTLRRSIMACMLWENEFYEDGETIADRIKDLIKSLPFDKLPKVAEMAIEARSKQHLRHVPLLVVRSLVYAGYPVADVLSEIIQRPDELAEFLSLYWKDGKTPIAKQVKKGLAKAFQKFSGYSLAKYNQDKDVKLRDVLFMVHAKPKDTEQAELWKKLVDGTLEIPDTWEVELSKGGDKKESWTRLIQQEKLGGLATLRNLRNMQEAGLESALITQAIAQADYSRVLPFRFIAAARYAPAYEADLEKAMLSRLEKYEKLPGETILLVDVSGSMNQNLSEKSDMLRCDAGFGLAMILREVCEKIHIFTFSENLIEIPARRGMALRDAMNASQPHSGTYLGSAVSRFKGVEFDRLIVISDEQSADSVPNMGKNAYMLNVASNKNGVGYGEWTHIDGFSEACVDYIIESEKGE